jgi:ribosomal protein S18 acetylase RimI-like enzyme
MKVKAPLKVILRDARDADYPDVAVLYAQPALINARTGNKVGSEQFLPHFNPQDYLTPKAFDHFRNGGKGHGVLVAEIDGKVAGICCFMNEPMIDYETGEKEDSPHVELLAVDEAFRGQGIGSKLLAEFQDRMKADGFKGVSLDVMKSNVGAAELYTRLGYETIHTTQDLIVEGRMPKLSVPNLKVAFATAADWDKIRQVQATAALPPGKGIMRFFDESVRGEMDEAQFKDIIASNDRRSVLVISDASKPVGFAVTQITNSSSADRRPKSLCVIHRFVAEPGAQDTLLDAVQNQAIANQCRAVRTFSLEGDVQREALLARHGFEGFRLYMDKRSGP